MELVILPLRLSHCCPDPTIWADHLRYSEFHHLNGSSSNTLLNGASEPKLQLIIGASRKAIESLTDQPCLANKKLHKSSPNKAWLHPRRKRSSSEQNQARAAVEGISKIKTGTLVSQSEQELVDRDVISGNQGCNGGFMYKAFQFIKKTGLTTEREHPYIEAICNKQKARYHYDRKSTCN